MKRMIKAVLIPAVFAVASMTFAQQKHQGTGVVKAIDTAKGSVMLKHEAIKSLGWSGMTMEFAVRDRKLLGALRSEQRVSFEVLEEKGRYFIVSIK